jgi:hypothetical protein
MDEHGHTLSRKEKIGRSRDSAEMAAPSGNPEGPQRFDHYLLR